MAPTGLKKALSYEAVRLASQKRVQQRHLQGLRAADGGSVEGSDEDRVPRGIQRRIVEQIVGLFVATVAKSVGEARPLGIAQYRTTTVRSRRVFLVKLGRLGLEHWIAKDSGRTEASSVEAVPSWPEADGTDSADDTAAVKSAGEARSLGIAKCSAVTVVNSQSLLVEMGFLGPEQMHRRRCSRRKVCWDCEVQRHFRIRVRSRR